MAVIKSSTDKEKVKQKMRGNSSKITQKAKNRESILKAKHGQKR